MLRQRELSNACRFDPRSRAGHYESYFQRANHPERPLAFWIRYTLFAPRGRPERARGELWAVWFDGEARRVTAVKQDAPLSSCRFSMGGLDVRIGEAVLRPERLDGEVRSHGHRLAWSLAYRSPEAPLWLLPRALYGARLPSAKAVVGSPNAVFSGWVVVDGVEHAIDGWIGSQNHNWGTRHTDAYAWGQVAGFDGAPDAFLELVTARVRLGPLTSPPLTAMVLRLDGREHRLNRIGQAIRARGRFRFFCWEFRSSASDVEVEGRIDAPRQAFVALPYENPPGGFKTCLNSKLARCRLGVRLGTGAPRTLSSAHRAAFEILTDAEDHGVPLLGA